MLIREGEMIMLVGESKVGKTLMSVDLAYSILNQTPFLGEQPSIQGKILFVLTEEFLNDTAKHLLTRGFDSRPNSDTCYVLRGVKLNNLSELKRLLENFKPTLVVFDYFPTMLTNSGISEKTEKATRKLSELQEVLHSYNAASLIIHSTTKQGKVSGHSGIPTVPSKMWFLTKNGMSGQEGTLKIYSSDSLIEKVETFINDEEYWKTQGIFYRCN